MKTVKKVLVTGAAGYLGDAVVELLREWHNVVAIDSLLYSDDYIKNPNTNFTTFRFYNMDIRNCAKLIEDEQFDAIIHLAGIVGDPACAFNEPWARDINVNGTRIIADAVMKHSPHTRVVFASSCSVFGAAQKDETLTMDSVVNPLSNYAIHKLEGEALVNGLPHYSILRLGTLYGLSTERARIRCDLVANIMTFRSVEGKDIPVFGGQQWRPLLNVNNAAIEFVQAIHDEENSTRIVASQNFTIKNMAERIVAANNSASRINETPMKFEDSRNYKVQCDVYESLEDFDREVKKLGDAYRSGAIKNPWNKRYHNGEYLKGIISGPKQTAAD